MKNLVIVGAGGFGREVAAIVEDINRQSPTWNFLGFIANNVGKESPEGYKTIMNDEGLFKSGLHPYVVIAIASPSVREKVVASYAEHGFEFATIIHPTVIIGPRVNIGEGTIVCEYCLLKPNTTLGAHCIINYMTTIGHDTVLGEFCSLMPHSNIAGEVSIGARCYFGLGATIINQVSVSQGCTLGAGAIVVRNIEEPGTYVGVPAKRIK